MCNYSHIEHTTHNTQQDQTAFAVGVNNTQVLAFVRFYMYAIQTPAVHSVSVAMQEKI